MQVDLMGADEIVEEWVEAVNVVAPDYGERLRGVGKWYVGTRENRALLRGRERVWAELERWLVGAEGEKRLWVTGPAGRGKTALLAQWAVATAEAGVWDVIFVPISRRWELSSGLVSLNVWGGQMVAAYDEPAPERLGGTGERWGQRVLALAERERERGLLIVVDGVDEAGDRLVAELLTELVLGERCRLVLGARERGEGMGGELVLPLLTGDGVRDVLAGMGVARDGWEVVERLAGGEPLLVRLYGALMAEGVTVAELDGWEVGLAGYVAYWWGRWGLEGTRQEVVMRFVLKVLACGWGALVVDDFVAVGTGMAAREEVVEVLTLLDPLLVGNEREGYLFIHEAVRAYFYGELAEAEVREGEQLYLDWGARTVEVLKGEAEAYRKVSSYVVRYYGTHLVRAGMGVERWVALLGRGWWQAWEREENGFNGFLHDVERVWWVVGEANRVADEAGERLPYFYEELVCVLSYSSVLALRTELEPMLVGALVGRGVWPPQQAFNYIYLMGNKESAANSLQAVMPYLPVSYWEKALRAITSLQDGALKTISLWVFWQQIDEPELSDYVERFMIDTAIATLLHDEILGSVVADFLDNYEYEGGADWVDMSWEFIQYVLKNRVDIQKVDRYGLTNQLIRMASSPFKSLSFLYPYLSVERQQQVEQLFFQKFLFYDLRELFICGQLLYPRGGDEWLAILRMYIAVNVDDMLNYLLYTWPRMVASFSAQFRQTVITILRQHEPIPQRTLLLISMGALTTEEWEQVEGWIADSRRPVDGLLLAYFAFYYQLERKWLVIIGDLLRVDHRYGYDYHYSYPFSATDQFNVWLALYYGQRENSQSEIFKGIEEVIKEEVSLAEWWQWLQADGETQKRNWPQFVQYLHVQRKDLENRSFVWGLENRSGFGLRQLLNVTPFLPLTSQSFIKETIVDLSQQMKKRKQHHFTEFLAPFVSLWADEDELLKRVGLRRSELPIDTYFAYCFEPKRFNLDRYWQLGMIENVFMKYHTTSRYIWLYPDFLVATRQYLTERLTWFLSALAETTVYQQVMIMGVTAGRWMGNTFKWLPTFEQVINEQPFYDFEFVRIMSRAIFWLPSPLGEQFLHKAESKSQQIKDEQAVFYLFDENSGLLRYPSHRLLEQTAAVSTSNDPRPQIFTLLTKLGLVDTLEEKLSLIEQLMALLEETGDIYLDSQRFITEDSTVIRALKGIVVHFEQLPEQVRFIKRAFKLALSLGYGDNRVLAFEILAPFLRYMDDEVGVAQQFMESMSEEYYDGRIYRRNQRVVIAFSTCQDGLTAQNLRTFEQYFESNDWLPALLKSSSHQNNKRKQSSPKTDAIMNRIREIGANDLYIFHQIQMVAPQVLYLSDSDREQAVTLLIQQVVENNQNKLETVIIMVYVMEILAEAERDNLLSYGLAWAEKIEDERDRCHSFLALLPLMRDAHKKGVVWHQVFSWARLIKHKIERVEVLTGLMRVSGIEEDVGIVGHEVIRVIKGITSHPRRMSALFMLTELKERLRGQDELVMAILDLMGDLREPRAKLQMLKDLQGVIPPTWDGWHLFLKVGRGVRRGGMIEILGDVVPRLVAVGGEGSERDLLRAVYDVRGWW